jgi:hypothetical protein
MSRGLASTCAASLLAFVLVTASPGAVGGPEMEVWKSAACGCCTAWVRHVEAAGFTVRVTEMEDVIPVKERLGVPPELSSCHTARVGGYVVEGHVPADDILRLLRARPQIAGIFLPGMPLGSPGMEAPRGEPYEVLALDAKGKTSVFSAHRP